MRSLASRTPSLRWLTLSLYYDLSRASEFYFLYSLFSLGDQKKKKLKFHQAADKELPLKGVIWFRFAPNTETVQTPHQRRCLLTNHGGQALGS